jgi:MotA/TolQ/ExbB proton channel family
MGKLRFDMLSVVGLILAVAALMVGAVLKGAGLAALWSAAAFVIVVMGTLASILIQTPMVVMSRALNIVRWVVSPPVSQGAETLRQFMDWSVIARKQGLLGLETLLEEVTDDYLRKGLQMLVDGAEPEEIRTVLEVELDIRETADLRAAKVFEGMGIYAPTLGIIGARLDGSDAEPCRPQQAGSRHRCCVHGNDLWYRPRQSVFPADGKQAQDHHSGAIAESRHDYRGHHRYRAGRKPAQHRNQATGISALSND